MDTHITTAPDVDERIGAPLGSPIRLPGGRGTLPHLEDHDLEPGNPAAAGTGTRDGVVSEPRAKLASATPARARRTGLLSTAAVVVVLAGLGGVAWAERQGAVNLPLPAHVVALLRTGLPASVPVAGEVGVRPARAQLAVPAVARPSSDQTAQAARRQAEFAALKPGGAVTEVGVSLDNHLADSPTPTISLPVVQVDPTPITSPAFISPPVATEASAPNNPPSGPALPPAAPQAIPAAAATVRPTVAMPAVTTPAIASPAPIPVPKPLDPVQTAIDLRAAPFSTTQQVEVVGLVRELGAQLKESRLTVAQMQATVAELKQQLDNRLTEFDGRLGLAEAGTVLAQSAKAALPQPVMTAAVAPGRSFVAAPVRTSVAARQPVSDAPVAAPVSSANRSVKDFRVQGASPGLAVLNVLVPGPGDAPVLYVSLGSQVPGLGHIKSIYQRGTTWVVQTDAGLIQ